MLCLLLTGGTLPAQLAPPEQVPFPAAVNLQAAPVRIGPVLDTTSGIADPEDVVFLDPVKKQFVLISGGYGGSSLGGETVVASTSVGSGVPLTNTSFPYQGCVSPAKVLYYFDPAQHAFVALDLKVSTYPRTLTPVPSNPALTPGSAGLYANAVCWDFSTGTIVYFDTGPNNVTSSTIARGIYRYNPITGTNTLIVAQPAPAPAGSAINSITLAPDGTIYGIINAYQNNLSVERSSVVRINTDAPNSYTNVDGGYAAYGTSDATKARYYNTFNLFWDFTNGRINVFDGGDVDATTARIIAVNPTSQTRTFVTNGSAGPAATYGGTFVNFPQFGYRQTNGRLIYSDANSGLTYTIFGAINAGSSTATAITSTTASNLGTSPGFDGTFVPPSLPVITSPTATAGGNGTGATLGANVTSSGAALVAPTITARGVVYAPTATNSSPTIGGTGVTQVASTAATGVYTVNATGLTAGTAYSYAGYASTIWGTAYSAVGTFTEPSAPSVTTNAATAIAGTTATLNGNVTSDGGSTITTRGFVYSATATNNAPVINATGVTNLTVAGTTGAYTGGATGLSTGTNYSFRAYATNGVNTTYGSVLTFTTIAPPTANSQTVNVPFNTATAITLTASDPNNPAQTLTYSVTSQPTHGTLSGTAPNLTYTPTTGYNGADSFQFTATNTTGLVSNTATVTLNVAAGVPTANSQSVSVPFNTATAITLAGSDPDIPAKTLTYTVVTTPTHGTLSGTAPNLTYTPTANYQGSDSFTFRVSNGTNTSNTATVSITVAAGTPTANSQSVTTTFNTAKAITLTGSDPDSPALTLTYTVTTAPTHGTLSGTAPNLTYTPTANYQGSDSFTFTVSNGQKTSSAATVSITVAAGTPTANSQSVNVNLNLPRTITLTGTDPDSPALSLTYTVVTQPTNGTLSGTAPNLTYTPNTGYTGADSFTFTVSNGQNTSSAATVSLIVIGQPTISSFTPASGPVNTLVTITGTNLQNATALNFFRNVPGTSFTIVSSTQVTVRVPTGAATGTLTVLSGSGSNSSSTKFTVTP